jgi:Flp pilus assembly protein TadG
VHPERGVSAIMAQKRMPASRRSGNSIIEVTFMMPWLLFLFVGVFDFGFYAYALIATQNAARAAAVHNSISSMAAADSDLSGCGIVLGELRSTPNASGLGSCTAGQVATTSQSTTVTFPQILQVESDYCQNPSSQNPGAQSPNPSSCPGSIPAGTGVASVDVAQVKVTYYTAVLIPIPGLLSGQLKITRTALAQVNPSADF